MNFYEVLFALKTGTNGFANHYETLFANALNGDSPTPTLSSITAVFNQGTATIYDTDTLDSLKQYLTVTATYSDSSTETVTTYTLSGTLTVGTSIITVTYQGKTDTFNVTVLATVTNYNMNYLYSDIVLSDGYIGDDGKVIAQSDSKFYNELIKAKGYWIAGSNGTYTANNLYLRVAEYDSNGDFIQRKAMNMADPIVADSGEYIKVGTNNWSTVTSRTDRFVACNILDTSICTIYGKTIDTSGNVQDASKSSVSDFLPINQGYMICQLGSTVTTDSALVVFYDNNHNFISRHGVTDNLSKSQLFVNVPSNAAYVRFRCENNPTFDTYVSYYV